MKIENVRTVKRELLFRVIGESGDTNVGNICPGCPLERLGCNRQVDTLNNIIIARVNLDSNRVQLAVKNKEEINCPANSEIKFRA